MQKSWKQNNLKLQRFERKLYPKKYKIIAGVDEAGRGPLAGPVVACAVILEEKTLSAKIGDSKRLTEPSRRKAFEEILQKAYVGVGVVNTKMIDKINILQATVMAIKEALENLAVKPEYLLLDGTFKKASFTYPYQTLVKGDNLCLSIASASIVAKVFRDNIMSYYATVFPQYGFSRNHGYYTKRHLQAIEKFGLTPLHRRSFRPICNYEKRG